MIIKSKTLASSRICGNSDEYCISFDIDEHNKITDTTERNTKRMMINII